MHIATVGVLSAAVCTCTATSLSVFFYTTLPSQPTHEGKRTPRRPAATFAAGVSLENKLAPWKKEESSAAELFNSCLSVVLPIVKEEVLIDRTPELCSVRVVLGPNTFGTQNRYFYRWGSSSSS